MKHAGGEQVMITLGALPDDVPLAVRLRCVLKYCLRACRLRAVRVEDVPAVDPAMPGDRPADAKPGASVGGD
jgi:hypothetical protein